MQKTDNSSTRQASTLCSKETASCAGGGGREVPDGFYQSQALARVLL